jgi:hypothetical protein
MDDRGPRLHVTNGDSTAEPLRETGIVGDVIVWMDALHDGPVPDVPRADLRRLRAAFLAGNGWGSADQITADFERRDAALQGALAEGRPVVLWFEHDLYDQLQLLEALSLVERPDGVELIVIGAFPGHPGFRGLGELSVGELATLWPGREPLTPAVLDLAHRAWTAVRAPEPGALRAVLRDDTGALPFLAPALRRLLDELPDAAGLSLSERLILQALADGPLTPVELFEETQDREAAPFAGDTWVWKVVAGLESLVTAVDGSRRIELTDAGRRVLDGAADRVELLGIDRWVGGIHLRPDAVFRR